MFCNKCGNQVEDGALVCPYCGNPMRQAPAAPEVPTPAADPMQNTGYINPVGGAVNPGMSGSVGADNSYVNPAGGYAAPAGVYPGAYAAPKKKSKAPLLIGGIIGLVAIIALVAVLAGGKPYVKPVKKLFKAYNTNSAKLLQEAVSPELYDAWYIERVTDEKNDDSFKVVSTRKLTGSDLSEMTSLYGVTQCYEVVVDDKIYVPSDGSYNEYTETFVVGKLNGKWKIVNIY